LRNKSPKRRVRAQLREDRSAPTAANQVWAMDFVHDQLFDGRKIRVLTVIDTFTRLSPAIDARQSFRGSDVVATLERLTREVGCPKTIRVDNGPEFVSRELDLWAFMRGVTLDFSRPGKPTDNAFIESLNGKFRAECLNANWFLSLDEARRKCEAWRRDCKRGAPAQHDRRPSARSASSVGQQSRPARRPMKPADSGRKWSKVGGKLNGQSTLLIPG
jgi:putative transposase